MCDSESIGNLRMHGRKPPFLAQSLSPPLIPPPYGADGAGTTYNGNTTINHANSNDPHKIMQMTKCTEQQSYNPPYNPSYNQPYDIQDSFDNHHQSFPIPISWIGKKPDLTNNRTQSTSSITSSANSEIQTHSAYSLCDDIDTDQEDQNTASTPIFIPLRPLTLDDVPIESISNPDVSYDSESESDRDEQPSPTADIGPIQFVQTATNVPSPPSLSPLITTSTTPKYGIGCHKQSTKKMLDIQITVTDDEQNEIERENKHKTIQTVSVSDSTCDYNDSLPNSTPRFIESPSSLDSLPPLPCLELSDKEDLQSDDDDDDDEYPEQQQQHKTATEQLLSKQETKNISDDVAIGIKEEQQQQPQQQKECIVQISKPETNITDQIERKGEDDNILSQQPQQPQQHKAGTVATSDQIEDEIGFVSPSPPTPPAPPPEPSYEDICNELLLQYDWQKPIKNEANYGPYYPSFQKEVMNNPFFKLTAGDFNDVLKKCQFIRSRWLGEKIRSTRCGQLGKAKWKIGEKISDIDLFAIKLYTDFEICQRELKKCYRPPIEDGINNIDIDIYEQRLCHFSHWRRLLNVAILKYGTLLKNRVFYHGINKIMKLNIHPTHQCNGPFSATSDIEIARGFATKNGLILKMTSKYPRLGTDYFFDAAPISAYPDEKEYLIGFMYTRILNVQLGCTKVSIHDLDKQTVQRLTCFIISSLIKNNLYSYGQYLELIFQALLITDKQYAEKIEHILYKFIDTKREKRAQKLERIAAMIPDIIKEQFKKCRAERRVLKLDTISNGMESLFYDENNGMLSMSKIYQFTPNIQELHLYEDYGINDEFITKFLYFIKLYEPSKINLNTVKVFKYSFEGHSEQFQFKQSISKSNEMHLNNRGWYIYEYHDAKCYKFTLTKKQRKK